MTTQKLQVIIEEIHKSTNKIWRNFIEIRQSKTSEYQIKLKLDNQQHSLFTIIKSKNNSKLIWNNLTSQNLDNIPKELEELILLQITKFKEHLKQNDLE